MAAKKERLGALAIVVIVAMIATVGCAGKKRSSVPSTTTTSTTSTTTTTIPPAPSAVMPLTGVGVDGADPAIAAVLARPALAAKIDNAPQAQPQAGIANADVVIEVMVEGISRFIAVFHSSVPDLVGPVRSARTSDPDLLAMFVKPIFVWSGGNRNVMNVIESTSWLDNASHDKRSQFYFREKSRRAPHNLLVRAPQLLEATAANGTAPQQLFDYRGPDEPAVGTPSSGFDVSVGSTLVSFRWDPVTSKWIRYSGGHPQLGLGDVPIAATNVVVAQTTYRPSPADSRSPEAVSLGEGAAWVFTGGNMIAGRWSRPQRDKAWALTDEAGAPIKLLPGNTWVELPAPPQAPRPVG